MVDSDVYTVIRHPLYLSVALLCLAPIAISQHWFAGLLSLPTLAMLYVGTQQEERRNVAKFGNDYRRYMQRVPALNFLVGILRLLRHKGRP